MLLITVDSGNLLSCAEYEQVTRLAELTVTSGADIYTMDVADNDICFYPSSAGTTASGTPMNALLAAGHDPFGIFTEILKEAGIAVVPNFRVNDHHGSPDQWTEWEREHKEWSLGQDTGTWKSYKKVGDPGWREVGDLRQMDYAVEAVRERRLGILREIADRYPLDGLMLDFGRSAPFFREPKREKADYMTQFVRAVRGMLDETGEKRGQHLMLAAAVPWDIDYCTEEGLDIKAWIDEGLLSYLCPGEWFFVDYNLPYSEWVALAEGSNCKVYPMLMSCVSSSDAVTPGKRVWLGDGFEEFDPPKIRALAESAYSQGADGIMFYNLHANSYASRLYTDLRELIDPASIPSTKRHYFFARRPKYLPTEYFSFGLPDGYAPGEVEAFTPFELNEAGDEFTYKVLFGSDLGGATADFQFKLRDLGDNDEVEVSMNGGKLRAESLESHQCQPPNLPEFRYAIWRSALGSSQLRVGENVLTVRLAKRDSGRTLPVQVGEFEITVGPDDG